MGFTSFWHWAILLLVVVLLFGQGKLSGVMGDLAKGIRNFKDGLADDDSDTPETAKHTLELKAERAPEHSETAAIGREGRQTV